LILIFLFVKDGHLRSGDHILQIGEVNVRGMGSEQVAAVLRQSGSHVRLVVARSIREPPQVQNPLAPIIPTHQLDEHLHRLFSADSTEHLDQYGYSEQNQDGQISGSNSMGFIEQAEVHAVSNPYILTILWLISSNSSGPSPGCKINCIMSFKFIA
jgi:hypothetical protein